VTGEFGKERYNTIMQLAIPKTSTREADVVGFIWMLLCAAAGTIALRWAFLHHRDVSEALFPFLLAAWLLIFFAVRGVLWRAFDWRTTQSVIILDISDIDLARAMGFRFVEANETIAQENLEGLSFQQEEKAEETLQNTVETNIIELSFANEIPETGPDLDYFSTAKHELQYV
jgi:hypothetical protein